MATHIPRAFYSREELDDLYPKELELQLVQIVRYKLLLAWAGLTSYSFYAMVNEHQYHRVSRMYANFATPLHNKTLTPC